MSDIQSSKIHSNSTNPAGGLSIDRFFLVILKGFYGKNINLNR